MNSRIDCFPVSKLDVEYCTTRRGLDDKHLQADVPFGCNNSLPMQVATLMCHPDQVTLRQQYHVMCF